MHYFGDIDPGKILYIHWPSSGLSGQSILPATAGTIEVYKDDGTTQSTAGITDTRTFDSVTGRHMLKIDTSADGTFYAAGHEFSVVLTGAVIDGQTVNTVLAHFSIQNRSALRPSTAGRTLAVSAAGQAGIDLANVGSPTTVVDLSGVTIRGVDDQEFRRNTAQAGAAGTITLDASASATTDYYKGALIAIVGGTGAGQARYCTAYNGTTKVASVGTNWATNPDNTSVFAILAADSGFSTAIKAKTDNLPAVPAAQSDCITAAGVRSAIGESTANLDTQLAAIAGYIDTEVAAIKAKTDNLPSDPADASDIAAAFTALFTTALTEAYAAHGAAPTVAQILFEMRALMAEKSVSGTVVTTKKLDGSTAAATYTLNDGSAPTAITRAT